MEAFEEIEIVLDATSAAAHKHNAEALAPYGKRLVDLTPAALGPFVIPVVNLSEHLDAANVNMVTCGGQATVPIVAAVSRVTPVPYAEIIASVASRSAGPGTRANIDEFTETTAHGIEAVGGATRGKAIIILNPAEPPLIMRDTVYCLIGDADHAAVTHSIAEIVAEVSRYVPGYRLKQEVQITPVDASSLTTLPSELTADVRWKVSTFLEVEGAADYLPPYAGNLDIMTSAALRVAEEIASRDHAEIVR
jgi:acetaldehyde dehydrogenase